MILNLTRKVPISQLVGAQIEFIIGNSKPVKLMDYISEIESCLKITAIKEFHPQPGDVQSTSSDSSLLEKFIDFKPNTSIRIGIKNFIDWYLDFYKIKL